MAVYNSSVGLSNQDDSDITIINPSIINEHNEEDVNNTYVPIITRLKQANNSSENRQITNSRSHSDDNEDRYIFVEHDPLENAKHLEQVLKFYIQDLRQETNTQLNCDQQLVTRLMDLIRPAYLNNQQKLTQLDSLKEEIGSLHDKRHMEQKEKIAQLHTEICRLNKMLFTASNDDSLYNKHNKTYSMYSTSSQGQSINDQDQWTEIEGDAKKLHEIVQTQKNQINEIVTLISQTATASASLDKPIVPINKPDEEEINKPTPPSPSTNAISTLLQKIMFLTGQQQPATITPPSDTTLINHSPGVSPTGSMATLISDTITPISNDSTKQAGNRQSIDDPTKKTDNQQPIPDQPHVPIVIPVPPHVPIVIPVPPPAPIVIPVPPPVPIVIPVPPPALPVELKKCPVCNHEFPADSDDLDMYDHIENCLFPTGIHAEPKDYTCPNCERKYPANEEMAYHQHLADCYRDM